VIGCAAMALTALGHHGDVASAADALIRYEADVLPDPAWAERYGRMQPVFDRIYRHSQALYDDLDQLMD
jgi:xylulokinase